MRFGEAVQIRDLLLLPNLLSLFRVALTPVVGFYLAQDGTRATIMAVVVMLVAGLTDGLDGYLARRLNQTSALGLILDPVADKLFAAVMVVFLVLYRDLPIWLAVVIVGRDLLILVAALIAPARLTAFPSTATGKYAFFYILLLIGFYTIRFDFGVTLFTWLVVGLIIAVAVVYGRRLVRMYRGLSEPPHSEPPLYGRLRVGLTVAILVVCAIKYYLDVIR
ncbi:MAG: CDP-alcohol phosphatidyltransferase family protein [Candidatus Zixiibacteriota bacterium]